MVNNSTKRKPNRTRREPVTTGRSLPPGEMQSLKGFVRYGLGDGHLTTYEEQFLSDRHLELYGQAMWLTDKQEVIIRQIKDKLHYDCQDVPLPSIDPDGIVENDDPDGWPVAKHQPEPVAEDVPPDWADE
jgi:hypothetical protein